VFEPDDSCAPLQSQITCSSLHIEIPEHGKFIFEIIDDGSVFDINEFHEPELDNLDSSKDEKEASASVWLKPLWTVLNT
jgi:hypothetical protein